MNLTARMNPWISHDVTLADGRTMPWPQYPDIRMGPNPAMATDAAPGCWLTASWMTR